ncbi:MAG: hypothetical protein J6U96_00160 [Elusimicrobiaceae bacterium]|nr:hypothetical protein [Elusimicrobiaceae bacterium]
MKKLFVLLAACGLCACAGVNKNTVSYQMSKYDPAVYYVIAGDGADKKAASENALANMRQNIEQNVPDVKMLSAQVDDLIANAKVAKVWRDKSIKNPKHYFALAVLKRAAGEKVLQGTADDLDGRLGALASKLKATEDKFAGLRAAFAMEPLIIKRNVLQDLYIFISQNHEGYETERFDGYKKAYNDRLAAVKVAAVIRGEENITLLSRITDALNSMGLSVTEPDDETALLSVEVDAQVDGYGSEKIKGLQWAATSAAVSLRDLQSGTTFARFNVHDRAGTSRKDDSVRKSMEGVGDKASAEIVERLTNYLKTK